MTFFFSSPVRTSPQVKSNVSSPLNDWYCKWRYFSPSRLQTFSLARLRRLAHLPPLSRLCQKSASPLRWASAHLAPHPSRKTNCTSRPCRSLRGHTCRIHPTLRESGEAAAAHRPQRNTLIVISTLDIQQRLTSWCKHTEIMTVSQPSHYKKNWSCFFFL